MYVKVSLLNALIKSNFPISWRKEFSNVLCYTTVNNSYFIFDIRDYIDELVEIIVSRLKELFNYTNILIEISQSINELIDEKCILSFAFIRDGKLFVPDETHYSENRRLYLKALILTYPLTI